MNPFTAKTIRSRKSTVEPFASLTRRREAKIGTDRLLMSVPFFAYWKNSFFSFCFYNIQHTLATDGLLGGRWTVDGGLEMLPAEASLSAFTTFSN